MKGRSTRSGWNFEIWLDSVGRSANLILNVPPDRDGKLREPDVKTLLEFRLLRDSLLAKDLAAGAKADGPARCGDAPFSPVNLADNIIESH